MSGTKSPEMQAKEAKEKLKECIDDTTLLETNPIEYITKVEEAKKGVVEKVLNKKIVKEGFINWLKDLDLNSHDKISYSLNDHYKMNFSSFIGGRLFEETEQLKRLLDRKESSIEEIKVCGEKLHASKAAIDAFLAHNPEENNLIRNSRWFEDTENTLKKYNTFMADKVPTPEKSIDHMQSTTASSVELKVAPTPKPESKSTAETHLVDPSSKEPTPKKQEAIPAIKESGIKHAEKNLGFFSALIKFFKLKVTHKEAPTSIAPATPKTTIPATTTTFAPTPSEIAAEKTTFKEIRTDIVQLNKAIRTPTGKPLSALNVQELEAYEKKLSSDFNEAKAKVDHFVNTTADAINSKAGAAPEKFQLETKKEHAVLLQVLLGGAKMLHDEKIKEIQQVRAAKSVEQKTTASTRALDGEIPTVDRLMDIPVESKAKPKQSGVPIDAKQPIKKAEEQKSATIPPSSGPSWLRSGAQTPKAASTQTKTAASRTPEKENTTSLSL